MSVFVFTFKETFAQTIYLGIFSTGRYVCLSATAASSSDVYAPVCLLPTSICLHHYSVVPTSPNLYNSYAAKALAKVRWLWCHLKFYVKESFGILEAFVLNHSVLNWPSSSENLLFNWPWRIAVDCFLFLVLTQILNCISLSWCLYSVLVCSVYRHLPALTPYTQANVCLKTL